MSKAPALQHARLRHYLLRWALGTLVLTWLALVALAWSTGYHEARKFSDAQLISVAQLWSTAAPVSAPGPAGIRPQMRLAQDEYVHEIAVLVWQGDAVITDTHGLGMAVDRTRLPEQGFVNLTLRHGDALEKWRAFSQAAVAGRRVLVLTDLRERQALGNDLAEHVAQPALLVLPLVALLLWWAVRRGLQPLDQLSREVAALDAFAGQRLDTEHRFAEFASTVTAINGLVDTLQTHAQRERAFASDVAHELRTPLASLSLLASAAQHDPSPERLKRLSAEALRAGHILSQLLDLARAQRAGGAQDPGARTDLVAVAARLVAEHAPDADQRGHELSLSAPEEAIWIQAPTLLIELALRNLIDNAVRHTPAGTQVQVAVSCDAHGIEVSVSDDGARSGQPPAPDATGLGLGLRLVERMAEPMGAVFVRDAGAAPMTTRFALRWDGRQA